MATSGPVRFGVTEPLSTALPTEAETTVSNALIEELKRQNNYESAADTNKRTVVLQSLQATVEEFVRHVSKQQGLPDIMIKSVGGKIFTFGSFRLGVFGPGSDIDTIVIAPKNVAREDFFMYMPDILKRMAPEGAITDFTAVPDAFVPVMKFEYSGISIDLLFCCLHAVTQVPRDMSLLGNIELLRGLDDGEVRSVNGPRVTDEILQLVPQPAIFRTALRGVKLWAQRRGIYANIMGFLGGVAWAMLVARVCQLYPRATGSTIILKFFRIMEKWQWPMPVLLKPIDKGNLQLKIWNPKIYPQDRGHLMPIITPSYPSMCATHNVTNSTLEIMKRELKRGGDITDRVMSGKGQWKELFMRHTFFTSGYKYYLSVIAASSAEDAQHVWAGRVESRVRFLVGALERHPSIALAHPFNKGRERKHKCHNDEEIEKAKSNLECQIKDDPTETIDPAKQSSRETKEKDETAGSEEKPREEKATYIYTSTWYIGLELREGAKSLDLSQQVETFKTAQLEWQGYNQELNALNVVHIKNYDLPDDVFIEGESKPTKPQRRRAANGVLKKRSATEETTNARVKRQQTSVTANSNSASMALSNTDPALGHK